MEGRGEEWGVVVVEGRGGVAVVEGRGGVAVVEGSGGGGSPRTQPWYHCMQD